VRLTAEPAGCATEDGLNAAEEQPVSVNVVVPYASHVALASRWSFAQT
jgi:hypothetical protein